MDHSTHDHRTAVETPAGSQRAEDRDSLLLTALLRALGEETDTQVRVRNLSAGGMMAENAPALTVGTPIVAELRGVGTVRGSVAWAAEGRLGIAFDTEIDPRLARKPVTVPARPRASGVRRVPL